MKIVFFETMPGEKESLTALLPPGHEVLFREEALTRDSVNLADGADIISVFITSNLHQEVLDELSSVKLITTRSMGFDHIDVPYATSKKIRVTNVTTYASHPVAEFTFALLLTVTRHIYHAYNQLREGTNFDIRGLKGSTVFGKTLGVVGTGRIGRNVATIAKGFGMNVALFDVKPDPALATQLSAPYLPLEQLVAQSDFISLHVPYTKATHHLFDARMFSKIKEGAVLINTARGEIIDTHALIAALRDGTVKAAGLDVLEAERQLHNEAAQAAANTPDIDYALIAANHVLIDLPNVIVTPHIAFETEEAMHEISRVTAQAIGMFIAGQEQTYLS